MKWMKKIFAMVSASVLLLSGCTSMQAEETTRPSAADPVPSTTQVQQQSVQYLTAEKKLAIEAAWKSQNGYQMGRWYSESDGKAVDGVRYYGSYAGVDILFEPTFDDVVTVQRIGGVMIQHNTSFELYAYLNGKLYELQQAFAEGLIDREAIQIIGRLHAQYEARFRPLELGKPEDLQVIEEMKLTFLEQFVKQDGFTTRDLSVVYYGEYNGAHVGFINGILVYTQALTSETVGNYTFHYVSGQTLLVFHDGQLMRLKEAYDNGVLDDGAIESLYSKFGGNGQEGEIR